MTESSLFTSPLGLVSLSPRLLWVIMSWDTPKRIHRLDDASASQEQKLTGDAVPGQTRTATNFWVGVFECFCREKQGQIDLKMCLAEDLDDCTSSTKGVVTFVPGQRFNGICCP